MNGRGIWADFDSAKLNRQGGFVEDLDFAMLNRRGFVEGLDWWHLERRLN
jgi:hypothetical protein